MWHLKNLNILVGFYSDPFALVVSKIRAPLTTTFMQGPVSIDSSYMSNRYSTIYHISALKSQRQFYRNPETLWNNSKGFNGIASESFGANKPH